MDYAKLKALIESGPNAAEYAPLVKAGDDASLAAALNRVRVGNTVSRGVVDKGPFLASMAPFVAGVIQIAATDPVKEPRQPAAAYWLEVYRLIVEQLPAFDCSDPVFQNFFAQVLAAGLIDQPTLDAITKRDGSEIEATFGPGVVVSMTDIGAVYQPDRAAAYTAAQSAINARADKLMTDPRVLKLAENNPAEARHLAQMLADQDLNGAKWGIA